MKLKKIEKNGKIRIFTATTVFLLCSLLIHMLFPLTIGFAENRLPNWNSLLFHFIERKYFKLWLYAELVAAMISLYVYIISDRQYVSDEIQVTDKIRIPAPAGQGQFGSARFATEQEIKKFFSFIDFYINDHKYEFSSIYRFNDEENQKLEKINVENFANESVTETIQDYLETDDVEINEKRMEEIVKFAGKRKDLRYLLKSKLSIDDLKKAELENITFDDYYARLNVKEFQEVIIAMNKARNKMKQIIIYENMVKKRYESILQLREIRYAIEDNIAGGYIELIANNSYDAEKMRQIRLAYKSEKIKNKKLIEKYMLNPRFNKRQLEEIRKALIEGMDNLDGIAHNEVSEELMMRIRGEYHHPVKPEPIYDRTEIKIFEKGGLVLGKENLSNGKERIYSVQDDLHSLVIGETGSGKTRSMVLQSIVTLGLAGENIVITDIKGELSEFTAEFLQNIGYQVIYLDFKNPLKSTRFNFLKPVIDAVNNDDIDYATEIIWDITTQLVGETKGEPIWQNGEAAIIAGAIMAVVYDNRENPEFQNFTNVYYFLSEMCKPIQIGKEQILPINEYANNLDEHHPAKGLFAIGEIAPSRTRGSFYTSALTTLRLFTSNRLADMTSEADFELESLATKKTAVFIILPEDRDTYNQIGALYVGLQYQALSRMADKVGGRLKIRTNFLLDEFGNFPKIPSFMQMITVARGKGVRFNLFLQDLSQLINIYEKEGANTIYGNCQIWVYLRTGNKETLELISTKLSQYTVSSYSVSGSTEINKNSSSSFSRQLSGRNLLNVNELALFSNPYSLVLSKINPAIMKSDDFSKWQYVKLLNMGTKEQDINVRYYRQKKRKERVAKKQELWDIKSEIVSELLMKGGEYYD